MSGFEYRVVPAPMRGLKARGVKGTPARFANALQTVMNDLGVEGWEYQRTDTLPVEERQGLTGKTTTFQNMLVFRRTLDAAAEEAPVIAALIEDQTVAPSEPEPLYLVEEASVETTIEDPVVAEDFIGDIADDYVDDAAKTLAAQDRVSETLKAPFSFPWNKRNVAATPKDADKRDTNIPAK
ncbi:MAG: DUF4177 domain-containing protein [Octadecabacter sp.]